MLMDTQIVPQIDLAYTDCKGHPGISMDVLGSTHPCGFSKKPSAIYTMQYTSPIIYSSQSPNK